MRSGCQSALDFAAGPAGLAGIGPFHRTQSTNSATLATGLGAYSIWSIGPLQRLVLIVAGVAVLVPDPLVAGASAAVVAASFAVERRLRGATAGTTMTVGKQR